MIVKSGRHICFRNIRGIWAFLLLCFSGADWLGRQTRIIRMSDDLTRQTTGTPGFEPFTITANVAIDAQMSDTFQIAVCNKCI